MDGLKWAESVGGSGAHRALRGESGRDREWVARGRLGGFLAEDPAIRSSTSICLKITPTRFPALAARSGGTAKTIVALLDKEGVAYDIGAYRDAPPGLRIWGGATVETSDLGRADAVAGLGRIRPAFSSAGREDRPRCRSPDQRQALPPPRWRSSAPAASKPM